MLCGLIISGYMSVYYYNEYTKYQTLYNETVENLRELKSHMLVDVLIDYGNGTQEWYNETRVPIGATLFDATKEIAKINYTTGQFGILITAINGRKGKPGYYWMWYIWNSTSGEWEMGPVAADAFTLHHGDTVSWVYEKPSW